MRSQHKGQRHDSEGNLRRWFTLLYKPHSTRSAPPETGSRVPVTILLQVPASSSCVLCPSRRCVCNGVKSVLPRHAIVIVTIHDTKPVPSCCIAVHVSTMPHPANNGRLVHQPQSSKPVTCVAIYLTQAVMLNQA